MLTSRVHTGISFPSHCCRLSCPVKNLPESCYRSLEKDEQPNLFILQIFYPFVSIVSQTTQIKEVTTQPLIFDKIIFSFLSFFFFFSQVRLREEYMKSTRAEPQQNRKATVLPHHLKHRHKKCTMRKNNVKILPCLPLQWELRKLGSCRERMSNYKRLLQYKIHLVKWRETAWVKEFFQFQPFIL